MRNAILTGMRSTAVTIPLLLAACGDPAGSGEIDTGLVDVDSGNNEDTASDVAPIDSGDNSPLPDAIEEDLSEDTDTAEPEGAALGEPCEEDGDCESGLCVDLLPGEGGAICSQPCVDDESCPDEFGCVLITGSGDAERLCLPDDLCLDPDGDLYGFGPDCLGADCDESSAARNPGADELCDGIDNNCNTRIDENPVGVGEDCSTSFPGECAEGITRCGLLGIECVGRNTPVAEICDGLDNNCDGASDEDLAIITFYIDADGDGFGDPDGETRAGCGRPLGFVENRSDCDDNNNIVFPGATETVGDGIDANCDAIEICYADIDNDDYRTEGLVTSSDLSCTGDGLAAASVPAGDCDDRDPDKNPGVRETVGDEIDMNCDGLELCWADADLDGARDLSVLGSIDTDCRDIGEARTIAIVDCDDGESRAFPGNVETCDDIDNDCDGRIDEGLGCYSLGDPCIDNRDCESGFCVGNECSDGLGCIVPGACPSRLTFATAAAVAPAGAPANRVFAGISIAATSLSVGDRRAILGAAAYTAEPRNLR